jgi:serine/threonine protein kinase
MPQTTLEAVARAYCASTGFVFKERVGEGAFKETFQVTSRNGPAALKLYKQGARNERSDRELDALRRCSHPSIAVFYSVTEFLYQDTKYLVQTEEFCAGGTLQKRAPLAVQDCLNIGAHLADALCHIASLNLVHRDIKPENIMFRKKNDTVPVIVDFGLVRNLGDTSITPSWLDRGPGTPYFAAPEQLNNDKPLIDWRCDQFSLGVTLAYLTLGFHPYAQNDDPGQTVSLVANRSGPTRQFTDGAIQSGLPALTRMVSPWPVQRFRTPQMLKKGWIEQEL